MHTVITVTTFRRPCEPRGKQDMQRTYNAALRCVHVTILTVEKKHLLHVLSVCL
jgi:hypothetical protein